MIELQRVLFLSSSFYLNSMRSVIIWILVVCISSCGTTYIQLGDGDNYANIYKNGKLIGTGRAKIVRNGPPQKITLSAEDDNGKELGRIVVKREATFGTLFFAILPYPTLISLFINLKFDRKIIIPYSDPYKNKSKWDEEEQKVSVWD